MEVELANPVSALDGWRSKREQDYSSYTSGYKGWVLGKQGSSWRDI